MFIKTIKTILISALMLGLTSPVFAKDEAVSIAGNMSVLSSYIWRGVPQLSQKNGAAFTGGLDFSFGAIPGLTIGNWNATAAAGSLETDYYVSYEGEAGDLGYSFGVSYYSYDWTGFNTKTVGSKTTNVASESEFFLGASYGDASGTYYIIPAQDATWKQGTSNNAGVALNWAELAYSTKVTGYDLGLTYGTGTYNHQFLNGAGRTPETTAILTVAFSKTINDNLSASFNKTHVLTQSVKNDKLVNQFWMALDYSF